MPPRFPNRLGLLAIAACALGVTVAPPAGATVQFQKVFINDYLAEHPDRQFVEFVSREAKCNTCHQGCKSRKLHNAYGAALGDLLDAKADRDDREKILAALRNVESRPADPKNTSATTFGQRIQGSQLPAGPLEEARREPTE
jgi:hypothetical protein